MILRERAIAALIAAEVVSTSGSYMSALALPWFVLTTTGSSARMSYVLAVEILPIALFGVPSGAVAARLGARRTMLVCDLVRAPLTALVPTLYLRDSLSYPLLLALVFLIGALFAPYYASQRVILPELVGDDERRLAQANSVLLAATRGASLVAPLTAGALVGVMGAANVLWLDAGSFLASFLLVARLVPPGEQAPPGADARGLLAGLGFLWRDPLLRPWLGAAAAFEAAGQALFAGLPVVVVARYGGHASVVGLFVAAFGAGAIAGNVFVYRLVRRFEPTLIVSLAKIPQVAAYWLLVPRVPAAAFASILAVVGLFNGMISGPFSAIQTARMPPGLRPKAMVASLTVTLVAGAAGLAVAGPVFASFGVTAVFAGVAGLQTAGMIVFSAVGLRSTVSARRVQRPDVRPSESGEHAR